MIFIIGAGITGLIIGSVVGYFMKPSNNFVEYDFTNDSFDITEYRIE